MENPFSDEYFMKKALQEAEFAFEKGENRKGMFGRLRNRILFGRHV